MKEVTLLYLRKGNEICLAEKQKKIGAGKLNGVGGKLDLDETPDQAAVRETMEEIQVRPTLYKKMAELIFHNNLAPDEDDKSMSDQLCHTYIATEWEGEPTETEEAKNPSWYNIDNLPYDRMMSDDRYWLPLILSGKAIKASFTFDKNWEMIEKTIEEVRGF